MNILEFLKSTHDETNPLRIRPAIYCADGFQMSVQASAYHYCEPRTNLFDCNYEEVEIGFPSIEEPLIMNYAENPENPTCTVYGWVPLTIVDEVLTKHGGITGQIDENGLTMFEYETR